MTLEFHLPRRHHDKHRRHHDQHRHPHHQRSRRTRPVRHPGLANLPVLFLDLDWGANTPPFALLLLNAAIGLVSVVCAAIAWNSGNRLAIRVNAAALIINAIMIVPGVFLGGPVWIPVVSAVTIVVTLTAVVLMMRRPATSAAVID